jgi:DNA-binding LacI/PurR family transcriptional regulator
LFTCIHEIRVSYQSYDAAVLGLTTIDTPKRAMGDMTIRRLHNLIRRRFSEIPVKNVLYTSLVVRNST